MDPTKLVDYSDLHLLVHNVSNTDVLLGIHVEDEASGTDAENLLATLATPKFDSVSALCELIQHSLKNAAGEWLVEPIVRRVEGSVLDSPDACSIPIGLTFKTPILVDADTLRFRMQPKAIPTGGQCAIECIYFPLVSTLVPFWVKEISRRTKNKGAPMRKVLYLLSGSSFLDDADSTKSNNSEQVGHLLRAFLLMVHSDIHVEHISSGPDVVHYDANVFFVKNQLVPIIDNQRRGLVTAHPESWRKHFTLVLSLAAGVPARVAALNAALRQYQPAYLHLSNVKAFWYSGDIAACQASLHLIDFDSVEGTPAISVADLDEESKELVMEMKRHMAKVLCVVRGTPDYRVYLHTAPPAATHTATHTSKGPASPCTSSHGARRGSMSLDRDLHGGAPELDIVDTGRVIGASSRSLSISKPSLASSSGEECGCDAGCHPSTVKLSSCESCSTLDSTDHELASFWLRKTRQPVLAVLLVRKGPFSKPQFFSGLNVEVSMPTGSICSERVAMSSALATDPGLKRRDIKAVAVLSLPKLDHPDPRVQYAYEAAGVAPASTFYKAGRSMSPPSKNEVMKPPPPRLPSAGKRSRSNKPDFPVSGAGARVHDVEFSSVGPEDRDGVPEAKRTRRDWGGTELGAKSPVPRAEWGGSQAGAAEHVSDWGGQPDHSGAPPGSFANQVSPNSREKGYAFTKRQASDGYTIEVPVALNPIAPCGSCMEWLKKVGEVNPDFKILTFTDISCDKVFVKTVPLS